MNEKTIDRQNELVDQAIDLSVAVFSKKHPVAPKDLERLVGLLAIAAPYDYQNLMAEEVIEALGRDLNAFYQEVERQRKSGSLTLRQAEDLRDSLGVAEGVKEQGTDPDAPALDEAE